MNLEKNKVFYEPWSFAIIEDCLNKKEISQVKKEIVNCTNYDDRVMVNRKRIHKGSKNFQYLTKLNYYNVRRAKFPLQRQ